MRPQVEKQGPPSQCAVPAPLPHLLERRAPPRAPGSSCGKIKAEGRTLPQAKELRGRWQHACPSRRQRCQLRRRCCSPNGGSWPAAARERCPLLGSVVHHAHGPLSVSLCPTLAEKLRSPVCLSTCVHCTVHLQVQNSHEVAWLLPPPERGCNVRHCPSEADSFWM